MTVAAKLQLRPGQSVSVLRQPPDVDLGLPDSVPAADDPASADAVLVFVRDSSELERHGAVGLTAAARDALAWIAYPKGRRLGTDLDRDRLADLARARGVRPVRQIAVDDVWSALRFRPA